MTYNGNSSSPEQLLGDLTEPQSEAVRHTDGPMLVLAGAGAGKTRVITRRAAYLAQTVTAAHKILAITFTNKAANEMKERIMALTGGTDQPGPTMTVCTFHSFCARMLRIHHDRAGLPPDFTVFDAADQRKLIKEAVAEAGLASENWTPARVQSVISNAKNAMITAGKFAESNGQWGTEQIGRIYVQYEAMLAKQHGLDFDDLLLKPALLLRDDAELRDTIERRYSHVLIDEYQDTNMAQYQIVRLITEQNSNVCATGDPDQSIYGWRGADINNILSFEKDYPNAKVVRLEQNYRSTKRILAAASALIEYNSARKAKTLWTENDTGERVRVVAANSADEESAFVAGRCAEYRSKGGDLSDIAVFYRINAMSRSVEEQLMSRGIPYQIARGTEFYNRKEIKDILAYLRVAANRHDALSLERIINTPTRGIGKTTIDRLKAHAAATEQELYDVVMMPAQVSSLGKAAVTKVEMFADLLGSVEPLAKQGPRNALEQTLIQSGLQASLSAQAEYDREPLENVEELVNAAASFEQDHPGGTLLEWLEYASLLGDVDAIENQTGSVTLMTLHAAKGLEFPVVFMIGLEDGLLPLVRQQDSEEADIEEERRLCFVGMTRAKRELTMTCAAYRMTRGSAERKRRSRFLKELSTQDVETVGEKPSRQVPTDLGDWHVGMLVRHPNRGLAKILWIQPNGEQTRLGLRFKDGTERNFMMRYAQLERVDHDEIDYDDVDYDDAACDDVDPDYDDIFDYD